MLDIFNNILGIDLTVYHIPDSILYVVLSTVVIFVIGEIFNIIRVALNHALGKK